MADILAKRYNNVFDNITAPWQLVKEITDEIYINIHGIKSNSDSE